jgi:hypothetical protein
MRKRIKVLKKDGGKKTQRTMKLVGCTVEELKQHIEKQFKPGMSWEQRDIYFTLIILFLAQVLI